MTPFAPAVGNSSPARWLGRAFLFAVVAFAWLRFSENTADNDLWGHVLYGQRMLQLGRVESTDVLSWTAAGQPWMNHETAAEVALALAHRAGGSAGLWGFMIAMALLTVTWAAAEGTRGRTHLAVTLALLAASTNFIASGYAVRPQLFTMLALVALLAVLRRFLAGRPGWGWALPPLFAAWVNFHGGYLAGWLVLLLALGVDALTQVARRRATGRSAAPGVAQAPTHLGARSILVAVACTAALGANPEGFHLLAWTVETVQLPRPAITEWHPAPVSLAAVPFYAVAAISAAAWVFSRRARPPWQAAVLVALGAMAALQQRHAPLFGLANLMFTPGHLGDTLDRLGRHCGSLRAALRRGVAQAAAGAALAAAGVAAIAASLGSRVHPFAMEVPADVYPLSAIAFMREHALKGNTVTFFDWGQQVLWELPDNPVSFDGRLDTVYPRDVMDAHWRLYAGESPGRGFDLARAAVALLPTGSGGIDLMRNDGWHLAYRDPLASVLVRQAAEFPRLAARPTVLAGPVAVRGRARFPDELPLLATAQRPR